MKPWEFCPALFSVHCSTTEVVVFFALTWVCWLIVVQGYSEHTAVCSSFCTKLEILRLINQSCLYNNNNMQIQATLSTCHHWVLVRGHSKEMRSLQTWWWGAGLSHEGWRELPCSVPSTQGAAQCLLLQCLFCLHRMCPDVRLHPWWFLAQKSSSCLMDGTQGHRI